MEKPATHPGPDCAMARGNREHRCECQPDQDASALLSGRLCPQAGDRGSAGAHFPGGCKGAMTRGIWSSVRPAESEAIARSKSNAHMPSISPGKAHQPIPYAAKPRLYAVAAAVKLFTPISSSTSRTAAIKPCIS